MSLSFEILKGKTFKEIEVIKDEDDYSYVIFTTNDNITYHLNHYYDCCELVMLEDINGDLNDLINSEIIMAECVSNRDWLSESGNEYRFNPHAGSQTWSFYKLTTTKGYVTIRFFGESNGNYSEEVELVILSQKELDALREQRYYSSQIYKG